MIKTPLIIEQHFHGAYGVDFNTVDTPEKIVDLACKLYKHGIGGFFPTLVTDSVENIKKQISVIKEAALNCDSILGIHLEGIFLNPLKKGIHNSNHFLNLTVENYKLFEDDFIKIVTLAPELDSGLIDYLKNNIGFTFDPGKFAFQKLATDCEIILSKLPLKVANTIKIKFLIIH